MVYACSRFLDVVYTIIVSIIDADYMDTLVIALNGTLTR